MLKFKFFLIVFFAFAMSQNSYSDAAKAAVCTGCHGVNGNSLNPIWPSLAGQGAGYIVQQLKAFKSKKRNNAIMWPFANSLSEDDMWSIALFYSKQPVNVKPVQETDKSAEKLYRGGDYTRKIPACMACHGPGGNGNAPAKYPSLKGQHAAYTASQLKAYRDGTRQHLMMQNIAQKLSDEDIEKVSEYVSSLY